jgi:monovalent cation:H+ antiporter-2, CPA2 family
MIESALIILGTAILIATAFHSFKLPPIVAYIVAGIIVGPACFGFISTPTDDFNITEIAAVLLMFTVGLEFSYKDLLRYGRPLLVLGLGQVVVTLIFFTGIFWLCFHFHVERAIFYSFLIIPSSTAVVLKLLHDNREFDTPFGRAAFSVLLVQDLAIIPMIIAIPFLMTPQALSESFLDSLFPLLLLIIMVLVLLFLISRYALPFILNRVSRTQNRDIFFFTILFICLGAAALMNRVGLSLSLGAFIAGMLLAGSHYGKQATAEILPLRDAFLSLFFIAVGTTLDVKFLFFHFPQIFVFGLAVFILKSAILFSLVWLAGNSGGISRAVTGLLFQVGEFSFVLAELGRKHAIFNNEDSQFFVSVAIVSLALTPFVYKKLPWLMHGEGWQNLTPKWLEKIAVSIRVLIRRHLQTADMSELTGEKGPSEHVIVIGYGVAGQSLCRVLQHLKIPFHVIELNAETVRIHSPHLPILFGDAAQAEILKAAGIAKARLVVSVTSGASMLGPILRAIHEQRPDIPVIARTNYLSDLGRLREHPPTHFVVSESETALEVIDLTLKSFAVESLLLSDLIAGIRKALHGELSPREN